MASYHSDSRFVIWTGTAVLSVVLACQWKVPSAVQETATIRIERQTQLAADQKHAGFEVFGLEADQWQAIGKLAESGESLSRLIGVFVQGQQTPVMGRVFVDGRRVVFEPRFKLADGVILEVVFQLTEGEPLQLRRFDFSASTPAAIPVVERVFPPANIVPQNVLRMYVQFSQTMKRGMAADCIRFLDFEGNAVEEAWLKIPEELWDRDGRQFTVLFDPGRIKRGLARHEQLGLPFQIGQTYTLVIDRSWQSADGMPLEQDFRHSFSIAHPDRVQPDPDRWKFMSPVAGTRQPLKIELGEILNAAMLEHAIAVKSGGRPVTGAVAVGADGTSWALTPGEPWHSGEFVIEIDPRLEDLAGNSIAKPFETEMVGNADAASQSTAKNARLRFTIQ